MCPADLGEEPMPNDAKLGLLAGVIGVIAAAVLSANRSVTPSPVAHAPPPAVHSPALSSPSTNALNSLDPGHRAEPASTPIARSARSPTVPPPAAHGWTISTRKHPVERPPGRAILGHLLAGFCAALDH